MHQIIVILRRSNTNTLLSFSDPVAASREHERIRKAMDNKEPEALFVKDEHGHIGCFVAADIQAALLSDLDKEYKANEEIKMLQARSQKRLNDRVQSDPILNMSSGAANFNLPGSRA